jgi:mono/diheme cytochrome c family protein
MVGKFVLGFLVAVAMILVAIQFVPYGRNHTNAPARQEPNWDSPRTRELAARACYDCHSNETQWPWYSNVAPFSWLLQYDVVEGRRELNYSRMDQPQREAANSAKEMQDGDMPPGLYPLAHPEARLSAAERDELIRGLQATFGASGQ